MLLTACVIVDFLCIHPFRDGNGRVSRLLTSLLVLQEGFNIGKYISIDKKINEYRYNYYQALKACSDGWHENRNTYRQPWTIQDMLPTWAGVSQLGSSAVMLTFLLFLILFTTLLAVEISIMVKAIKKGPQL